MLENFIVGLILAALSAITFLAYKHPTAYNKLSPTISKIAMAIVIAITAYNFGLIKARDAIREHISITNSSLIMNAIESREISMGIAFLIYFVYIVYFIFLDNLPYLFKGKSGKIRVRENQGQTYKIHSKKIGAEGKRGGKEGQACLLTFLTDFRRGGTGVCQRSSGKGDMTMKVLKTVLGDVLAGFIMMSCSSTLLFPDHLKAEDNHIKQHHPAKTDSPKGKKIVGMVFVKGGCFQMGDVFGDGYPGERPAHEVCVNDFYIGESEVTQKEWVAVMGANPSVSNTGNNYPVDSVEWEDAQEFIEKLNQKTGKKYRLPTEAEWEYAARSKGKKEKFAGTNRESELEEYAWYYDNSEGVTHPVKQKKPNTLGLYDMSGNVWEWVYDFYDGDYYRVSPKDNPTGPARRTSYHILRGGSWYSEARNVRTTDRYWADVDVEGSDSLFGFRLVLSPE